MYKKQQGTVVVEMAIIISLLIIITFGITEFGRAMYQYNILTKTVRDAARYLSVQSPGDNLEPGGLTTYQVARNLTVYGNPQGTGLPLISGLDRSMVQIFDSTNDLASKAQGVNPAINLVTVKIVGFTFVSLAPIPLVNINQITYNDISVSMRQVL